MMMFFPLLLLARKAHDEWMSRISITSLFLCGGQRLFGCCLVLAYLFSFDFQLSQSRWFRGAFVRYPGLLCFALLRLLSQPS
jgi:hypothetical protein